MNWSWAIYNEKNNGEVYNYELLPDLDCLAINFKISNFGSQNTKQRPFIYLMHYYFDVENFVGFLERSKTAKAHVKLFRTNINDRRRARNRKNCGTDFQFVNTQKDEFAKDYAEFGRLWKYEYNYKRNPSAR